MYFPLYKNQTYRTVLTFSLKRLQHSLIPLIRSSIYLYKHLFKESLVYNSLLSVITSDSCDFLGFDSINFLDDCLLSFRTRPLDLVQEFSSFRLQSPYTLQYPYYRANISFVNKFGKLCFYAGEIPVFPLRASLLSLVPDFLPINSSVNIITTYNNVLPSFPLFFVDYVTSSIIDSCIIYSGTLNTLDISHLHNIPNLAIYSPAITGVPVFISESSLTLECEHTHPLTEYLQGPKAFNISNHLKQTFSTYI